MNHETTKQNGGIVLWQFPCPLLKASLVLTAQVIRADVANRSEYLEFLLMIETIGKLNPKTAFAVENRSTSWFNNFLMALESAQPGITKYPDNCFPN